MMHDTSVHTLLPAQEEKLHLLSPGVAGLLLPAGLLFPVKFIMLLSRMLLLLLQERGVWTADSCWGGFPACA
jgi:hypothetical protein